MRLSVGKGVVPHLSFSLQRSLDLFGFSGIALFSTMSFLLFLLLSCGERLQPNWRRSPSERTTPTLGAYFSLISILSNSSLLILIVQLYSRVDLLPFWVRFGFCPWIAFCRGPMPPGLCTLSCIFQTWFLPASSFMDGFGHLKEKEKKEYDP